MKHLKTGTSLGFPTSLTIGGPNALPASEPKKSRFSALLAFGSFLLMSLQLISNKADATAIPTSSFSCTQTTSPTSSCVVGAYASGWNSGTGYWEYQINTTGYTGISMTFNNQKSSAAGPTTGNVYYNIGAGDVFVQSFTVGTSCQSKTISFPSNINNLSNVIVRVKMAGATNGTATHRMPSNGGFDGTTSNCNSVVAGSVSGASSVCSGFSTTLTLGGATAGAGISYQWQSAPTASGPWTNIAGATSLSYVTPALTATTYYRATTSCSFSGLNATTSVFTETVNTVSISSITGLNADPLLVDGKDTLANATPAGLWLSSNPSVATIDELTGIITGVKGGTTIISYQVTDGGTGCTGAVTTPVNVVWPNTLALYAGTGGNSTGVIGIPGESTGNVTATGFGTASPCGSGGISGLTVSTGVTAFNAATGPYVSYVITPDAGKALNVRRIVATTRSSGTGPTKARIAYRVNGGSWIDEGRDVAQNTGAGCGANGTRWDYTDAVTGNNPTINGITGSIEVAIFPYAPGASTGTFQLNALEVYGLITSDVPCAGNPNPGTVTPSAIYICDSGSRWLTFTGDAGVNVSYQWEKSTTSPVSGFSNISGATGASYNTGMLYAPSVVYYRVTTSCNTVGSTGAATSAADTVNVNAIPSAGTITGAPAAYLNVGSSVSLGNTGGTAGGTPNYYFWRSDDTSVVSIDSATGLATAHLPGYATITLVHNVGNCYGTARDTIKAVFPNTIAAYIGMGGNSTFVDASPSVASASTLAQTGYGVAGPCSRGGMSGLTNNGVFAYNDANAHAFFELTPVATTTISNIHATLRRSSNGLQYARIAYSVNGGSWVDNGTDLDVDLDDCGYSTSDLDFPVSITVGSGDFVDFAIYAYAPGAAGGTFQINAIDIVGSGTPLKPVAVGNVEKAGNVQLYPNPAADVLNIAAGETVNVTILSIDGKKLIGQKDAKAVNISNLASGLYLIQVTDAHNNLIKTAKFTKQ